MGKKAQKLEEGVMSFQLWCGRKSLLKTLHLLYLCIHKRQATGQLQKEANEFQICFFRCQMQSCAATFTILVKGKREEMKIQMPHLGKHVYCVTQTSDSTLENHLQDSLFHNTFLNAKLNGLLFFNFLCLCYLPLNSLALAIRTWEHKMVFSVM